MEVSFGRLLRSDTDHGSRVYFDVEKSCWVVTYLKEDKVRATYTQGLKVSMHDAGIRIVAADMEQMVASTCRTMVDHGRTMVDHGRPMVDHGRP